MTWRSNVFARQMGSFALQAGCCLRSEAADGAVADRFACAFCMDSLFLHQRDHYHHDHNMHDILTLLNHLQKRKQKKIYAIASAAKDGADVRCGWAWARTVKLSWTDVSHTH